MDQIIKTVWALCYKRVYVWKLEFFILQVGNEYVDKALDLSGIRWDRHSMLRRIVN